MSDFLKKQAEDQAKGAADEGSDGAADKKYPDTWKPTEGDQMIGILREISWPFVPTANENRWLLEIEDLNNKRWTVWCSNAVLRGLVTDVMPAKDAEIVITCGGEGKSKAGYTYRKYQMAASESHPQTYLDIMSDTKRKEEVKAAMRNDPVGGGGVPANADDLAAPF